MARITRVGFAALLTVAATMGVTGTAMARNGADDPPGDDRGGVTTTTTTTGGAATGGDDRGGLRGGGGDRSDVRRAGTCTGGTAVKIKLSPEDGRIEAEAEVDQNRNGVIWSWRMSRGRTTLASGRTATRPPSGSFEVRRVVSDTAGSDTITFRATSPSGEVCTARATLA